MYYMSRNSLFFPTLFALSMLLPDSVGSAASSSRANDESDQPELPPVPAGCIRVGKTVSCPTTEPEAAAALLTSGPDPYIASNQSSIVVNGFVRDGWPFVVDFSSMPQTQTMLRIYLFQERFFDPGLRVLSIPIDIEGSGKRQLFHLPAMDLHSGKQVGEGQLRVARFEIESKYLKPDGKPSKKRAPVTIFGIGAGPAAVGSITVSDVSLGQAQSALQIPKPKNSTVPVPIRYDLKRSFPLVAVRVRNDCKKIFCNSVAYAPTPASASSGLKTDSWPLSGKAKPGGYRLFVSAWLTCQGAAFPNCMNDAAWAVGFSPILAVIK
jgi:hypothetical protein